MAAILTQPQCINELRITFMFFHIQVLCLTQYPNFCNKTERQYHCSYFTYCMLLIKNGWMVIYILNISLVIKIMQMMYSTATYKFSGLVACQATQCLKVFLKPGTYIGIPSSHWFVSGTICSVMVYVNVDIMAVCLLSVVCLSRQIQGMSTKTLCNHRHAASRDMARNHCTQWQAGRCLNIMDKFLKWSWNLEGVVSWMGQYVYCSVHLYLGCFWTIRISQWSSEWSNFCSWSPFWT